MALLTEDYFDLSPSAIAWWEPIIQNHPFSAIFAQERYAALLEIKRDRAPWRRSSERDSPVAQ